MAIYSFQEMVIGSFSTALDDHHYARLVSDKKLIQFSRLLSGGSIQMDLSTIVP